ncbi:hypothetical protein BCR36DRAFT_578965 [Piromyces finnis]|uniref:Uncharacterized protein n=1 Tax=Piromyces finnis TaxID=1754191 RepID=A0A1Y1VN97_9FUNG|nr:hypothetical protein BCR36DRAFT_578965 [Piromyces finnis]|eukprot:ORX60889.1 hypothetical protein BCR36DRAFT_578965 [Piromyces finnis]
MEKNKKSNSHGLNIKGGKAIFYVPKKSNGEGNDKDEIQNMESQTSKILVSNQEKSSDLNIDGKKSKVEKKDEIKYNDKNKTEANETKTTENIRKSENKTNRRETISNIQSISFDKTFLKNIVDKVVTNKIDINNKEEINKHAVNVLKELKKIGTFSSNVIIPMNINMDSSSTSKTKLTDKDINKSITKDKSSKSNLPKSSISNSNTITSSKPDVIKITNKNSTLSNEGLKNSSLKNGVSKLLNNSSNSSKNDQLKISSGSLSNTIETTKNKTTEILIENEIINDDDNKNDNTFKSSLLKSPSTNIIITDEPSSAKKLSNKESIILESSDIKPKTSILDLSKTSTTKSLLSDKIEENYSSKDDKLKFSTHEISIHRNDEKNDSSKTSINYIGEKSETFNLIGKDNSPMDIDKISSLESIKNSKFLDNSNNEKSVSQKDESNLKLIPQFDSILSSKKKDSEPIKINDIMIFEDEDEDLMEIDPIEEIKEGTGLIENKSQNTVNIIKDNSKDKITSNQISDKPSSENQLKKDKSFSVSNIFSFEMKSLSQELTEENEKIGEQSKRNKDNNNVNSENDKKNIDIEPIIIEKDDDVLVVKNNEKDKDKNNIIEEDSDTTIIIKKNRIIEEENDVNDIKINKMKDNNNKKDLTDEIKINKKENIIIEDDETKEKMEEDKDILIVTSKISDSENNIQDNNLSRKEKKNPAIGEDNKNFQNVINKDSNKLKSIDVDATIEEVDIQIDKDKNKTSESGKKDKNHDNEVQMIDNENDRIMEKNVKNLEKDESKKESNELNKNIEISDVINVKDKQEEDIQIINQNNNTEETNEKVLEIDNDVQIISKKKGKPSKDKNIPEDVESGKEVQIITEKEKSKSIDDNELEKSIKSKKRKSISEINNEKMVENKNDELSENIQIIDSKDNSAEKKRKDRKSKITKSIEEFGEEDEEFLINNLNINKEEKDKIKKYFFSEIDGKIDKIIENRLDEILNESIDSLIEKNNKMSNNKQISKDIKKITLYEIIRLFVNDVDDGGDGNETIYKGISSDGIKKESELLVDLNEDLYEREGLIKKKVNNNDKIMIVEVPRKVVKKRDNKIMVIDDEFDETKYDTTIYDKEKPIRIEKRYSSKKSTLPKPYKVVDNNVMNDLSLLCDLSTNINTILNETKTKEMKYCLESISNFVKEQKSIMCQNIKPKRNDAIEIVIPVNNYSLKRKFNSDDDEDFTINIKSIKNFKKKKIMVVDDDDDIEEIISSDENDNELEATSSSSLPNTSDTFNNSEYVTSETNSIIDSDSDSDSEYERGTIKKLVKNKQSLKNRKATSISDTESEYEEKSRKNSKSQKPSKNKVTDSISDSDSEEIEIPIKKSKKKQSIAVSDTDSDYDDNFNRRKSLKKKSKKQVSLGEVTPKLYSFDELQHMKDETVYSPNQLRNVVRKKSITNSTTYKSSNKKEKKK